ncbi:uncharacterized protein LOC120894510 [Anopheles arabiensis]|uniref:uncharacterized protein LOC120894510 n=1 Tax=Anopheles arabiensis TaxID=7173 RepID=UPI001AACEFB3|nr:uncharacterized protein LOC120894510 [Anopheles arabiensis]
MEYSSFVRELRRESHSPYVNSSDSQYAREFEEQMQALVINYDIEEPCAEEQHAPRYSFTSTPQPSGSGLRLARTKPPSTVTADEAARGAEEEVPKKKIAMNFDQCGPESSQGSFESSEGISMRYDSCNSIDDIPHLVSCDEFACDAPTIRGEKRKLGSPVPFEALQGEEDSMLEPAKYDLYPSASTPATTKLLTVPAKRTYDEANR